MAYRKDDNTLFTVIMWICLFICWGLGTAFYQWGTHSDMSGKIKRLEAVGSEGQYLIFLEEGEVLENSDSFFNGKWNSSDVYNRLEEGECYDFGVYGWRVQFLSWYKNVLEYDEVPCDQ